MTTTIDGFEVDVFVSVAPSHQARLTQFPIESGGEISDHIILTPLMLNVSGVVTDTPLANVQRDPATFSKPSVDAYDLFVRIQREKRLVSVVTDVFPAFQNMALVSLSPTKTAATGECLAFTATFQQAEYVSVAAGEAETLVELPREKKKVNKGNQASKEEPEAKKPEGAKVSGRGKTVTYRVGEYLVGLAN